MEHMTAELNIPIAKNMSLDSLTSKIAQILRTYRTVRLEIEGNSIRADHLGRRDEVEDDLDALIKRHDLNNFPWSNSLLDTMIQATITHKGYIIKNIFVKSKTEVLRAVGLPTDTALSHILGAEIIEGCDLMDYQLILGLATSYLVTIGQLMKIVIVELPMIDKEQEGVIDVVS